MSVKPIHIIGIVVAVLALAFAAMQVIYIGGVFEEKSLFSYLLKSGDPNPGSPGAAAHIQGMAAYGRSAATGVALGGVVFGLLVGSIATQWWLQRKHRHAA